ncbi:MAG: hypothetical protein ACFB51_05280 [Anaerolineae bacterium]
MVVRSWVILIAYVGAACSLTWPLISVAPTHLPLGTETSATVPLFNLWTLRWTAANLGTAGYWHAPIFYPAEGAFAFSEPQLPTGLAFAVLQWITNNPILSYNLLLLLILTLNGWAFYHFGKARDIPEGAAVLAGILGIGLPFVFNELGVLQLTVLFPAVFAARTVTRMAAEPSTDKGLTLGLWIALTYLMTGYYGLMLVLLLPVFTAGVVRFEALDRRHFLAVGLSLGAATLMIAPVATIQATHTQQFTRSEESIQRNSAELANYTQPDDAALRAHVLPTQPPDGQPLYPGTVLLQLAAVGAICHADRRMAGFLVVGAVLALLLSLGLNLRLGVWRPYALLIDIMPGFDRLRSPFRFAAFVQLFLLMLATLGLDVLWQQRFGPALCLLLVMAGTLETARVPLQMEAVPELQPDWAERLPADAVVALIPFPNSGRTPAYEQTALAMNQAFGVPMVNGYSGFFPTGYRLLFDSMESFPDGFTSSRLQRTGVTYLAVDSDWLSVERHEILHELGFELVFADTDRALYVFDQSP